MRTLNVQVGTLLVRYKYFNANITFQSIAFGNGLRGRRAARRALVARQNAHKSSPHRHNLEAQLVLIRQKRPTHAMTTSVVQVKCLYKAYNFSLFTSVDCTWNTWSDWDDCSVTCGDGTQMRSRTQNAAECNGAACTGDASDTQTCNVRECPSEYSKVRKTFDDFGVF